MSTVCKCWSGYNPRRLYRRLSVWGDRQALRKSSQAEYLHGARGVQRKGSFPNWAPGKAAQRERYLNRDLLSGNWSNQMHLYPDKTTWRTRDSHRSWAINLPSYILPSLLRETLGLSLSLVFPECEEGRAHQRLKGSSSCRNGVEDVRGFTLWSRL